LKHFEWEGDLLLVWKHCTRVFHAFELASDVMHKKEWFEVNEQLAVDWHGPECSMWHDHDVRWRPTLKAWPPLN
jgi:hypothetical protein